jgi:hypothetical protein
MKKRYNTKPPRKMKPFFLVFCEGETEEAYINFLRQKYRLPVKLISHITGQSISNDIILRYIKSEKISAYDKITSFLMYDLDIADIAEKLSKCKNAISISSNPCIELWFLLHHKEQYSAVTSNACEVALRHVSPEWAHYEKGTLSMHQKRILWDNREDACTGAKKLRQGDNPSSTVYYLIETLNLQYNNGLNVHNKR